MSAVAVSPLGVYQAHLRDGKLAYQFSVEAGKPVFYPREICPYTGSGRLEWRMSAGLGTVYSATTVHVRNGAPYNVSLVDCDEGFRLMTRVEGLAADQVRVGLRVKFAGALEDDGDPYPVFRPVEAA
jgi:uncharacterized OB-fold protein